MLTQRHNLPSIDWSKASVALSGDRFQVVDMPGQPSILCVFASANALLALSHELI
jgi:hypothetical protein